MENHCFGLLKHEPWRPKTQACLPKTRALSFRDPGLSFREPCLSFREPCSSVREGCSSFREGCSSFREPCSSLGGRGRRCGTDTRGGIGRRDDEPERGWAHGVRGRKCGTDIRGGSWRRRVGSMESAGQGAERTYGEGTCQRSK